MYEDKSSYNTAFIFSTISWNREHLFWVLPFSTEETNCFNSGSTCRKRNWANWILLSRYLQCFEIENLCICFCHSKVTYIVFFNVCLVSIDKVLKKTWRFRRSDWGKQWAWCATVGVGRRWLSDTRARGAAEWPAIDISNLGNVFRSL